MAHDYNIVFRLQSPRTILILTRQFYAKRQGMPILQAFPVYLTSLYRTPLLRSCASRFSRWVYLCFFLPIIEISQGHRN